MSKKILIGVIVVLLFAVAIYAGSRLIKEDTNNVIVTPKDVSTNTVSDKPEKKSSASINVSELNNEEDNNDNEITQSSVKKMFLKYIKDEMDSKTLSDYEVTDVKILSNAEKNELATIMTEYKYVDALAIVTYKVKPLDINNTNWDAGNGERSGEWIVNKVLNVAIENGTLKSIGTGW